MGIPMPPPPIDYGNDCLTCFAAGLTPIRLYVRFFLLVSCPTAFGRTCKAVPNGRVFVVDQNPGSPCQYNYLDANWSVHFDFNFVGPHRSRVTMSDIPGYIYFDSTVLGCMPDGHIFQNNLVACGPLVCNFVGIAIVSWTTEGYELMRKLVLPEANTTFMEFFEDDSNTTLYRFASHYHRMNIKVKQT